MQLEDKSISTDTVEIADTLRQHWEKVFSEKPIDEHSAEQQLLCHGPIRGAGPLELQICAKAVVILLYSDATASFAAIRAQGVPSAAGARTHLRQRDRSLREGERTRCLSSSKPTHQSLTNALSYNPSSKITLSQPKHMAASVPARSRR